jgi:hypothetical protein
VNAATLEKHEEWHLSADMNKAGRFIGAGRSASVYLEYSDEGFPLARKVFTGESLARLVLLMLTGSANPYTWCRAAIASAAARRRVMVPLVKYWFGDKLRLPQFHRYGWDSENKAFYLLTELIDGNHAPVQTPLHALRKDYYAELVDDLMYPLVDRLVESGFDGLVWQAGRGNPVASNNFMLERNTDQWVWIDMESGVPALFAVNPLATLFYYLPKSVKHRRWLFDDVDCFKLKKYLAQNQQGITSANSKEVFQQLLENVELLQREQTDWRSVKRTHRSIEYALSQGKIDARQGEFYKEHALRWYLRTGWRGFRHLVKKVPQILSAGFEFLKSIRLKHSLRRIRKYATSTRFRQGVARWIVVRRIKFWNQRGQLSLDEAYDLRKRFHNETASVTLTDFSAHAVIKPVTDVATYFAVGSLLATAMVDEVTAVVLVVVSGPAARTLYTLPRVVQEFTRQQQLSWIALVVGMLPAVGSLAYPCELMYRGGRRKDLLAQFIIFDAITSIGRQLPIWGGADSRTEHFFGRKIAMKLLGN